MSIYRKLLTYCAGALIAVPFLASCQGEPDITRSQQIAAYNSKQIITDSGVPWGMTWLPDGSMLVSYREGYIKQYRFKEGLDEPIEAINILDVPAVEVGRQGGLLDIALHPNYAENGWLYFTYAKADKQGNKSTAISRAKLKDNRLVEHQLLYAAEAYDDAGVHFGSRIAFDGQGFLYFSIGDRGSRDVNPQNLSRDGGKIYRLTDDGKVPADNPFVNTAGAKTAVYSYGHRNPQGMAAHPKTGQIWSHEHGPRGGDEVNLITKGANYGWPVISYGINYSGTKFTDLTHQDGMEQPLWYWDPSIAPSGMVFVTSPLYPQWQNHLLVGSLKFGYLVLLTLDGNKVVSQQIVVENLIRVRNVRQGPDGAIYVGVDATGIYKIAPAKQAL